MNNKETHKAINFRLDWDTAQQLEKYAISKNKSVSLVVREMIKKGLSVESYKEDESQILANMEESLKDVMSGYMERLISLQSKSSICSSIAMLESEFLLQRMSNSKDKEKALKMLDAIYLAAVNFVKTPNNNIETYLMENSRRMEEEWKKL